eukprot:gene15719-62105_t
MAVAPAPSGPRASPASLLRASPWCDQGAPVAWCDHSAPSGTPPPLHEQLSIVVPGQCSAPLGAGAEHCPGRGSEGTGDTSPSSESHDGIPPLPSNSNAHSPNDGQPAQWWAPEQDSPRPVPARGPESAAAPAPAEGAEGSPRFFPIACAGKWPSAPVPSPPVVAALRAGPVARTPSPSKDGGGGACEQGETPCRSGEEWGRSVSSSMNGALRPSRAHDPYATAEDSAEPC